jgi:multicomponent Na+:H+ antiporter subunit G
MLLTGSAFMFLASLGLARMPDLFTRLQSTTKAATLGMICMLLAVAVSFADVGVYIRCLLIIAFVFLTAPVAAHAIARAAYHAGVRLWERSIADEFRRVP